MYCIHSMKKAFHYMILIDTKFLRLGNIASIFLAVHIFQQLFDSSLDDSHCQRQMSSKTHIVFDLENTLYRLHVHSHG